MEKQDLMQFWMINDVAVQNYKELLEINSGLGLKTPCDV